MKPTRRQILVNPILGLPAASRLAELEPSAREALGQLLLELRDDARAKAQLAWRRNKGPMACYWKAVAVYANHTRRALRQGRPV